MNVKIEPSWYEELKAEFDKPYFSELVLKIKSEKSAGKIIYPNGTDIFKCFELTPFDKVKVIILGQDPYHNPQQAMGLCFSVPSSVNLPPSLKNIFIELNDDLDIPISTNGDLSSWAQQGVLLLNSILTVRQNEPASHSKYGWETFTEAVIKILSHKKTGLAFVLWGNYAKQKINLIDASKHLILTASHPSPFSAYNGFFGCNHFSQINEFLLEQNKDPINWRLNTI